MRAIELIDEEQQHQRELGYTEEHDDQHVSGELGRAGISYAEKAISEIEGVDIDWPPYNWPEGWEVADENSQIEYLVKAGALIASEIDRLLRQAGGVSR